MAARKAGVAAQNNGAEWRLRLRRCDITIALAKGMRPCRAERSNWYTRAGGTQAGRGRLPKVCKKRVCRSPRSEARGARGPVSQHATVYMCEPMNADVSMSMRAFRFHVCRLFAGRHGCPTWHGRTALGGRSGRRDRREAGAAARRRAADADHRHGPKQPFRQQLTATTAHDGHRHGPELPLPTANNGQCG